MLFCFVPYLRKLNFVNNGASQGIKIYSPTLSQKIDDYYNYKPSAIRTGARDTVYAGNLKKEIFETKKQKLSFLLGVYSRYGIDVGNIHQFFQMFKKENLFKEDKEYDSTTYAILSMPNAPTKARLCEEFLKELACEDVEYIYRKSIPAGNFVIFKPSDEILKIMNEATRLDKYVETINTNHVEFTPNGTKYIWVEPDKPHITNR